jgi:serine/threonine protein kinase
MSPEQALGEAFDATTDLWAIGVLAFLCLVGRFPYDGPQLAS